MLNPSGVTTLAATDSRNPYCKVARRRLYLPTRVDQHPDQNAPPAEYQRAGDGLSSGERVGNPLPYTTDTRIGQLSHPGHPRPGAAHSRCRGTIARLTRSDAVTASVIGGLQPQPGRESKPTIRLLQIKSRVAAQYRHPRLHRPRRLEVIGCRKRFAGIVPLTTSAPPGTYIPHPILLAAVPKARAPPHLKKQNSARTIFVVRAPIEIQPLC